MTPAEPLAKPTPPSAAVRREAFAPVIVAFHWTTLAAVLALYGLALSIDRASDAATAATLLTAHRTLGVLVWGLTAIRLGWRLVGAPHPAWPEAMPAWRRLAARLNAYALYALLLAQPITGLLQSFFRGKPFQLIVWTVPAVMARDRALARLMETLHTAGAVLLALLVGLHAAAALLHLARRDGIFESMAPALRRAKPSPPRA